MRPNTNLTECLEQTWDRRWQHQRSGDTSRARARRCLEILGPDRPAKRLRAPEVRRLALTLRDSGLAPASVNRHLSALSAVLEQAGVEGLLAGAWQREPKGRTRWLTRDEVTHLAQACLPHKHGAAVASLVRFLAETGMRVGEALALTWDDIKGPRAHVRDSKNGEQRVVPLTTDAVHAASTRYESRTGPWHGLSQSTVNHVFRTAREAVLTTQDDLEVVPHTLRHTCASRLTRAGVPLPVIQSWLGHRDFRSTLRYTHTDDEGLQAAAQRLQDYTQVQSGLRSVVEAETPRA